MKTIKFIIQPTIVTVLSFITIFLIIVGVTFFIDSTKQDEVDPPTEKVESTQSSPKPFTESPVQPIRKTYDEDYALRLMSVPRKNITDINVVNDYDATLSKLQYNVNNNVATFKDKEILRVYYNIQEEQNND